MKQRFVAFFSGTALAWAVALLLIVPARGEEKPAQKKHLSFQVSILPSDPFSEANQVGKEAKEPVSIPQGETFLIQIQGTPAPGWHTYPLTLRAPSQEPEQLSSLTLAGGEFVKSLSPVSESKPQWKDYRPKLDEVLLEHDTPFTWTQEAYLLPNAPVNQVINLSIRIRAEVCSGSCVWEDYALQVPIKVVDNPDRSEPAGIATRLAAKPPQPEVLPYPPGIPPLPAAAPSGKSSAPGSGRSGSSSGGRPLPGNKSEGFLGSLFAALVGGLVALLTPCVFPMIPITVSFFLKQSEPVAPRLGEVSLGGGGSSTGFSSSPPGAKGGEVSLAKPHSAVLLAAVYSGTIVLVLTLGGMVLLRVLSSISVHYATNFALGGIFLFFALSLLGMYDITLPSWLQDATSSRERSGGLIGTFFMALTFSIISFACVGPIYGGFITLEATAARSAASYLRQFAAVFTFSVAFASPFFVLALFPNLLRSMPRAGSWMNSVKVVLGFLELAAVVKFLRAAELSLTGTSTLLTFDLSLGIYVALALGCGIYLLGLYRLPHDHEAPESIGVPRLVFSLVFLTLSLYLAPGLFKGENGESQRPSGQIYAWVESFLLPDSVQAASTSGKQNSEALVWRRNLPEALEEAKREKKLVFIDFTGKLCTNCKLNERNVFSRPDVQEALKRHVLVQLDAQVDAPGVNQVPNAAGTEKLSIERFGTSQLPLYALVRPEGDSFEIARAYRLGDGNGLITDVPDFIQFLTGQ